MNISRLLHLNYLIMEVRGSSLLLLLSLDFLTLFYRFLVASVALKDFLSLLYIIKYYFYMFIYKANIKYLDIIYSGLTRGQSDLLESQNVTDKLLYLISFSNIIFRSKNDEEFIDK